MKFAGALRAIVFQNVDRGRVVALRSSIQRGAVAGNSIDISAAQDQFLNHGSVTVKRRLCKRSSATSVSRIYVCTLIQQVADSIEPAFTRSEKQRRAATATRIYLDSGHLQQTQAAHISIGRRPGKVSLPSRACAGKKVNESEGQEQRA